jgi:hypothetical protein
VKVCNTTKKPVKTLLLNVESPYMYIQIQNRQLFSCFFSQTFCSKNLSTAPLTLGFSQLISVGQKSSVTNSGVKRVIFETFHFFFAQRYSKTRIHLGAEIEKKKILPIKFRNKIIQPWQLNFSFPADT